MPLEQSPFDLPNDGLMPVFGDACFARVDDRTAVIEFAAT